MTNIDPPLYALSSDHTNFTQTSNIIQPSSNTPFLLNLTTLPPALSFLSGYLGVGPAFLQGELQIKLISNSTSFSITRISISFRGKERTQVTQDPIDLVEQNQVLWDSHLSQSSSSNTSDHPTNPKPPSIIPFQLPLTSDLPHCIHLPNHCGLRYELEAQVSYTSNYHQHNQPEPLAEHAHVKVPVHILRYSKPGQQPSPPCLSDLLLEPPQPFTLSPVRLNTTSPTPISVSLSQTLLRHSEPLALQVRIPPPADQLIRDKGLRLRSVRAELHRHIRVRDPAIQSFPTPDSHSITKSSSRAPPYSNHQTEPHHLDSIPTASTSSPSELEFPSRVITSVLAMSGKSCRFSTTRSIFLRLKLHPRLLDSEPLSTQYDTDSGSASSRAAVASESSCETITQSTILHDVYFSVTVTIHITGRGGEILDVRLNQPVGIVPDWPPILPPQPSLAAAGKAREAAEECASDELDDAFHGGQGPAPTYFETDDSFEETNLGATASTSASVEPSQFQDGDASDEEEEDEEEEYDGYESFSSHAGQDGPAPPTIDEDESPPPAPDTPPEGIDLSHLNRVPSFQTSSTMRLNPNNEVPLILPNRELRSNQHHPENTFEFVSFEPVEIEAAFGRFVSRPENSQARYAQLHSSARPEIPDMVTNGAGEPQPAYDENENMDGQATRMAESGRPPAYAAGWATLPPPPVILPVSLVTSDEPTDDVVTATTHPVSSNHNAPPPYAADFGCLPPGSIGVVGQDGELGGFVIRR